MSPPDQLDVLIDRTQQRIDRLERLTGQKAAKQLPISARFTNHVTKHGGHITNAVLAGCVFAIAWGQLQQKCQHQGELREKDEQMSKLRTENRRLEDRVQLLESNIRQLGDDVRQELDHGGWRLSPVAQRLRNLLHSDAADGAQARPAGAPPAAAIVQPGGSALPPPRGNMI